MKKLFRKITPFFVLTVVGLIATVVEILILFLSTNDKGGLGTGLLSILAILLYSFLLFDRYLIRKIEYKKIVITEVLLLFILPFLYLYINRETKVYIETYRSYYILVYSENGINKEQIKASGLFDHTLKIKNDSIIRLKYSLYNDKNFVVIEPKNWGGHSIKYLDTLINTKQIKIEMYSNNLTKEKRDSIFRQQLPISLMQY